MASRQGQELAPEGQTEPPKATPDPAPPVANPAALDVTVSIPPIEVRWVNASTLRDFELYFFATSIAFTTFLTAFVAFLQSVFGKNATADYPLLGLAIFALTVFVLFLAGALTKRSELDKTGQTQTWRATQPGT